MTDLKSDEMATGFLEHALSKATEEVVSEQTQTLLRAAARQLGFFGLLASLATDEVEVDPEVRDELLEPLERDLRDAMAGFAESADVPALLARYASSKGDRGPGLLARVVSRVIYEVWDLQSHRFVQDDALHACDLVGWAGPNQDAREMAKRVCQLSRHAARRTVGHLAEQLAFVHEMAHGELDPRRINRVLHEYAPRLYAQRMPSIASLLVGEEPRFRFGFVLWGRLRGVVLGRAGVQSVAEHIIPEQPQVLLEALAKRGPQLQALIAADQAHPVAGAIERVFLARKLDAD
jgi:hypothetical protein